MSQSTDPTIDALERASLQWARLVAQVAGRLSTRGIPAQLVALIRGSRTVDEWFLDAHLIAVALRQIAQHLAQMTRFRTAGIQQAAQAFLDEFNTSDLRILRNLLEHQAEYIAEAPSRRVDHLSYVHDRLSPIGFGSGGGTRISIFVYVFGREYRIDPIIEKTAALERELETRAGA